MENSRGAAAHSACVCSGGRGERARTHARTHPRTYTRTHACTHAQTHTHVTQQRLADLCFRGRIHGRRQRGADVAPQSGLRRLVCLECRLLLLRLYLCTRRRSAALSAHPGHITAYETSTADFRSEIDQINPKNIRSQQSHQHPKYLSRDIDQTTPRDNRSRQIRSSHKTSDYIYRSKDPARTTLHRPVGVDEGSTKRHTRARKRTKQIPDM